MKTRGDLEALLNYGPSGSKQESRDVAESHLQALARLERIERLCLATKKDSGEIRWVRMFATDILEVIDPSVDWHQVAYGGGDE